MVSNVSVYDTANSFNIKVLVSWDDITILHVTNMSFFFFIISKHLIRHAKEFPHEVPALDNGTLGSGRVQY